MPIQASASRPSSSWQLVHRPLQEHRSGENRLRTDYDVRGCNRFIVLGFFALQVTG